MSKNHTYHKTNLCDKALFNSQLHFVVRNWHLKDNITKVKLNKIKSNNHAKN